MTTRHAISVVDQGTVRPASFMRWTACCALFALLSSPLFVLGQNTMGHSDNRIVNADVVPQANVDPNTVILPVVEENSLHFRRFSTEDGLSETMVTQIVQDNQGFIWFASLYGLNRYDGYKFKVFKHEPDRPNSLSGVHNYCLFKDRSGALWIGFEEFLDRFDPITETATHYRIGGANGETYPVRSISQDHSGMLWLGTSGGLYRLNPSTGETIRYRHDPNNPFSLSSNIVKYTGEDKEGTLWVASSEGVDAFDWKAGKVTLHIPLPEIGEMSFQEDRSGLLWIVHATGGGLAVFDRNTNTLTQYSVHAAHLSDSLTGMLSVLQDRDGTLWFGTMGDGILRFDRNEHKFIRSRHDPSNSESLGEDDVSTLFQDREGNIWAGLHMMAANTFAPRPPLFEKFKHEPGKTDSFSGTMVNGIYEDRRGILWISAIDSLNRVDRKTGKYTFYRMGRPQVNWRPTAIVEDRAGSLWVASNGKGLFRFDLKTGRLKEFRRSPTDRFSLSNDYVNRLLIDHAGRLWAVTEDGLNRFDPETSRFTVYRAEKENAEQADLDVEEDRDGALWIGADPSGLQRFDPSTGRFTNLYRHDSNDPTSLSNNRVNSVYFDHSGAMWVGTQDGLDKFDRSAGTFKTYYEKDGLSGNVVSCILEDGRGNLWMSTNKGVSKLDSSRQTFKRYSTADGLPGADLTGFGSCFKSSSGEMFFGGFSGGISFYPDKVVDTPYVPPVVLSDFRLSGNPVSIGSGSPLEQSIGYTHTLRLSHDKNIFSLEFSALSFFNPETNLYRYRLEGLDHQWHEVGSSQRLVTYTTLPTGTYTFLAQGATSRGAWSDPGLKLTIEILPPWWATWWFRMFCIVASGAVLGGFYRLHIQQVRREEKQLREVVETIPAMAFTAGPDGSSEFVNRRWVEFAGITEKAILSSSRQLTVHPDDVEEHLTKWRASLATGAPFENEARHCDAHGAYRWFLVRAVPLRDRHGTILKWYGTLTDIEDRKCAEERLQELRTNMSQTSKASMGEEISASIAHEINQPLTSVLANAQASSRWLGAAPPKIDEAVTSIGRVVRDAKAIDAVMRNVRSLFKRQPVVRAPFNMVLLIQDAVSLIREDVDRRFTPIEFHFEQPLLIVLAERYQIQQMIINLVGNAIEAMQGIDRSPLLRIRVKRIADGQVLTEFIDNGCGLPVDNINSIFDAFVSTKENGMGIGLAISRSIVEAHGGRLWAENNPDFGATFSLLLRPPEPMTRAAQSSIFS
jgi:PAS domain S-box-containing protein